MKLWKYRILSIMIHSVKATIVLLPLNIIAIWITPNRKKDISKIKLILIRWEDKTGHKNSWYKIKANQLKNYGVLLNLKFMKFEISSFENNWVVRSAIRNKSKPQKRWMSSKIKSCFKCLRCWNCPTSTHQSQKQS